MSESPLLVIVGPTASGKSELAMNIALKYNGELICADSRTIYKGMDIGTAKPTQADRAAVPHHLLDLVEPGEKFTAADFKRLAIAAITDIEKRGKLPIMVGGSGLYVDAVIFDYRFGAPADMQRRQELLELSVEDLQVICRDNNIEIPENSQNKRHLVRAIELGGLPKVNRVMRPFTLVVGISTQKDELRGRVEHRARAMVAAGILNEVHTLDQRYGWDTEAMTGNIYRVFREVLEGTKTEQEAIAEVVRSDMALVKRQLTWFKRNPHIVWGTPEELLPHIDSFVTGL